MFQEQVASELKACKTAKKGTSRLFRMLFTKEETEGSSLFGQPKLGTDNRPGLEHRNKLQFLEGIEFVAICNMLLEGIEFLAICNMLN
ncbi:hypothetical protein DPMN_040607 [Dreissena polymorpha]|uniref:Uncharacterized protein n=1 Tax=Dreissena polymorpha TaxID=45954 RepID=A0A9D4CY11_DREPO|nr:hypothetical protein DPMN_040589 [Dreissena polymorpha]KAH3734167.1 hypothetical protein DPMN_040607 [Dreissena polymorpha]